MQRFLPLAYKLARRYARSSEPQEDLVQVASLALVKAIDRFDPSRGSFPAFAIPTILGELKRYFRDSGWAVHVPRGVQERALAIERASEQLTNDYHGRTPTIEQIAAYLGITDEQVLDGLQATRAYEALSLNAPNNSSENDSERTVGDTLGSEDGRYELIEADTTVARALRCLPERERRILHLRFVEDLTQSEIAARIGLSQMQVSRLLRRSITQLREHVGVTVAA